MTVLIIRKILQYNSGLGDFATIPGIDCDINIKVVVALYYVNIATTLICCAIISRYLIMKSLRDEKYCFAPSDPRTIFPWLLNLGSILQIIFSVGKVMSSNNLIIGRDIFPTILGSLLPPLAEIGLISYFFVVLKCLKSYIGIQPENRGSVLTDRFRLLGAASIVIAPIFAIFSFMPTVGLGFPEHRRDFAMLYFIGIGVIAWLCGIVTTTALRYLIGELKSHIKNFPQTLGDVKSVLWRITLAYYVLAVSIFLLGFSFIICGFSDVFLRKATYLILFQQLCCPPASTILILTVSRISQSNQISPFKPFTDFGGSNVIPHAPTNSDGSELRD